MQQEWTAYSLNYPLVSPCYKQGILYVAYSSIDSWKPAIHVFDWLIFCYGNLILYQKRN